MSNGNELNPRLETKPAINVAIAYGVVTLVVAALAMVLSFIDIWFAAISFTLGLVFICWLWTWFYLRMIYVSKNTGVILIHQKNGRQFAIGGKDTIEEVNGIQQKKGQSGLRIKPSIFLTTDSADDIIPLERSSVDDLSVNVISSDGVRFRVDYSVSFSPDDGRLVEYRRIKTKVNGALEASLSSLISNIGGDLTKKEIEKMKPLQDRVTKDLNRVRAANDPATSEKRKMSIGDDIKNLWALHELFAKIEEVRTGPDQRAVDEGVPQAKAVMKIAETYTEVKIPPRDSREYLAYLALAPTVLKDPKSKAPGPQVPPDDKTEEVRTQRDALALAVMFKQQGTVNRATALQQAQVTANQSTGIVSSGGGTLSVVQPDLKGNSGHRRKRNN